MLSVLAHVSQMTIAKAASFSPYQNYDDPSYEGYNALYCCLATVGLAILCINRQVDDREMAE